jgi:hypothetical protein
VVTVTYSWILDPIKLYEAAVDVNGTKLRALNESFPQYILK